MGLRSYPEAIPHAYCCTSTSLFSPFFFSFLLSSLHSTHPSSFFTPPSQLILADKYERYDLTYEGCHVFNPGRFVGDAFEWSTYYPATQRSERR